MEFSSCRCAAVEPAGMTGPTMSGTRSGRKTIALSPSNAANSAAEAPAQSAAMTACSALLARRPVSSAAAAGAPKTSSASHVPCPGRPWASGVPSRSNGSTTNPAAPAASPATAPAGQRPAACAGAARGHGQEGGRDERQDEREGRAPAQRVGLEEPGGALGHDEGQQAGADERIPAGARRARRAVRLAPGRSSSGGDRARRAARARGGAGRAARRRGPGRTRRRAPGRRGGHSGERPPGGLGGRARQQRRACAAEREAPALGRALEGGQLGPHREAPGAPCSTAAAGRRGRGSATRGRSRRAPQRALRAAGAAGAPGPAPEPGGSRARVRPP